MLQPPEYPTPLSAGDTATQLTHELCTYEPEKKKALEEIGGSFRVHISAESSLAFKADLSIPWNKLRTIRLVYCMYMYMYNKIKPLIYHINVQMVIHVGGGNQL